MFDYLKKLFGTTEEGKPEAITFEELEKRLGENDIKIVNLSDGGYVSKEKYDAKNTELNGIKEQLENANNEIQSYKDMDIDGIKQASADWQKKYTEETEALTKRLEAQERSHKEEMFLKNYKFTSKAAEAGIKALFEQEEFKLKDGEFLGAKDFMNNLMEDDEYKGAFATEEPAPEPQGEGGKNEPPKKPQFSQSRKGDPEPPKKKSLAELMKLKNENPDADISFE